MKTVKKVTSDLRINKWSNDTLSPLSMKEYFKLCENLIGEDEVAKSAMMATSLSKTFAQRKNMIIATDQRIAIARKNSGVRYKNIYVDYSEVINLKISQDYYMHSRIYASLKYKTKFLNLFNSKKNINFEVMDPTSAFHFKHYLDAKIKKIQKLQQETEQIRN